MSYSLIIDIVVAVLLIIMIGYAISLNKRLGMLRRDRGELEKLAHTFTRSTERANESLGQLHATAEVLQRQIDTAQALHDDLAFLLERGEKAADRLEDTIRSSRAQNNAQAEDFAKSSVTPEQTPERQSASNPDKATDMTINKKADKTMEKNPGAGDGYSQSDAERDLLKALRSAK